MKSIEVFLDESGSMGVGKLPMNVTGIVMLSPDEDASGRFHAAFYEAASRTSLLAGLCHGDKRKAGRLNPPANYIAKRASPQTDEAREAHMHRILELVTLAADTAKAWQIDIGAFSLIFPATSGKPWFAPEDWENELLDRSYLERVKDVLELLFFETPWMLGPLANPCRLSLDLPTRSVDARPPADVPIDQLGESLWVRWGLKNDGLGQDELRVDSLAPSDAAEILTSILNRRKNGFPKDCVQVSRSRCVRLMDWGKWKKDFWHADQRNRFIQTAIRPVQIHYLADFLANAVYQSSSLLSNATVAEWFRRGFLLNAVNQKIDPWILACRLFANGDHAGALRILHREDATSAGQSSGDFFRMRSREWFRQLSGEDLRILFHEIKPPTAVEAWDAKWVESEPVAPHPRCIEPSPARTTGQPDSKAD